MSSSEFYRGQALQQQSAADIAKLENVRVRCQRAADAWTDLAARSERGDVNRAAASAEKALLEPSENPDRGLMRV
jgi:hypothetical protein